jgi:hypothetical protein
VGDNQARAIITTERHAYGAMTPLARFHHYSVIIKSSLHVRTAQPSHTEGLVDAGKLRSITNACHR